MCSNYLLDLHESVPKDVFLDKEEHINFWKSFAHASRSMNFFRILQPYDKGIFYNLAHISGKTDKILMKILS